LYFMITALAVFCLKQVGLVLLIVPGIMISAVFFLAPQLAVREGCSPYQALRRALVLSRGYRLAFGTVVAMFFGAEMMLVLISRGLLSAWYETATTTTLTIVLMGVLIAIKAAVAVAAFAQLRE
ncbi:MAG: hypothetical protein KAI28_09560, partial [Sphingomonadales bacterium]|nr:hypothetical protein [Sphingomonadales bacterium]